MFIQTIFFIFSIALTILFFLYGFNHYYLLNAARRYIAPELPPESMAGKHRVAIHVPVFNEKYVIHRLLSACASMAENYGIDRVKIVIIDDSDDETVEVIDQEVAAYQARHLEIEVLRRNSRQGYKAGALQAALDRTEEEFIAVFDADFIPPSNFLVSTVPFFIQNERLGVIQCRWTHINRNYNVLTGAIAIGIDVHFLIEQAGRYAAQCFQNFNGSGGILRKKALLQAGGWQADTLAEDLDASYRIQMQGYQILYLRDLNCPGEVPPTVPSYKKQQGRWACGSLRTAKKLLPILLLNRDIGFKRRLEAFIHLTGYLVHPLMFASFMLACLATLLRVEVFHFGRILTNVQNSAQSSPIGVTASLLPSYLFWGLGGLLIVLCTVAAWIPPFMVLEAQHLPLWRKLSSFGILFLLGCGISLNNTIEAGKALLTRRNWAFTRTPKYAVQFSEEQWRDKRYQVSLDFECILEFVLVCLGGISIGFSILNSRFGVLLILFPFTVAYSFVFLLTILQSRQVQGG